MHEFHTVVTAMLWTWAGILPWCSRPKVHFQSSADCQNVRSGIFYLTLHPWLPLIHPVCPFPNWILSNSSLKNNVWRSILELEMQFKFIFYSMCINILPACIYVHQPHWIPWTWGYRWLWATTWMLRLRPYSSARASAHHCRAISPAQRQQILKSSLNQNCWNLASTGFQVVYA